MVEIKNEYGEVFHRSRNLRGIMDYARMFKNAATTLYQVERTLHVHFPDGSTCRTEFADASVLAYWIGRRVIFGRGRFKLGETGPGGRAAL